MELDSDMSNVSYLLALRFFFSSSTVISTALIETINEEHRIFACFLRFQILGVWEGQKKQLN